MPVETRWWGVLNDEEIERLCDPLFNSEPLLEPFVPRQEGCPSYGLGSYGYDLRLGRVFMRLKLSEEGVIRTLDPVDSRDEWERFETEGDAVIMPPGEVWLAETVEYFRMPRDLIAVCFGKSSYARCGLLVNAVPIEPGWNGRLTLELKNLNPDRGIKLYIGMGISQVIFFRGANVPKRAYGEKEAGGAYQDQPGVMAAQAGGAKMLLGEMFLRHYNHHRS